MTPKVTRYCTSATANEKRGGTKKKSKDATAANDAKTAGPRPKRIATSVTTSRYIIAMLVGWNTDPSGRATDVTAAQAIAA